MLAHSLFFYFFSSIAVLAAVMVTISKNTVYSVFFLILDFVSVSILFIMIGAEFLGMIMLIVYVGAVAVLFLFVVMMLNVGEKRKQPESKKNFINNISVGSIVGVIIFLELLVVIGGWKYQSTYISLLSEKSNINFSNTHQLGKVLYTDYIYLFQISGMILLVGMIGAITLTFNKKDNIKRQNYFDQISRDKESSIKIVDAERGKGVKLDG
jgi:NADH-quinone oxidoreductase subunit J